jgi:hypothetical protein
MQVAPSFPVGGKGHQSPRQIVRGLLGRFGDRSFIRSIEIGKPPPHRVIRHFFPGKQPPKDSVWAYIDAPEASFDGSSHPSDARVRDYTVARWEADLVGGALRDDFCRAGGPTLAGWTLSRTMVDGGVSDGTFALNQRFPNLAPSDFRARAALAGKRYGFRVESIRFLRPLQLAPIVIVRTSRDREAFIRDVAAIVDVLNPASVSRHERGLTYEGILFEARDERGPFVRVDQSYRGAIVGGDWSAERGVYPYEHSGPQFTNGTLSRGGQRVAARPRGYHGE